MHKITAIRPDGNLEIDGLSSVFYVEPDSAKTLVFFKVEVEIGKNFFDWNDDLIFLDLPKSHYRLSDESDKAAFEKDVLFVIERDWPYLFPPHLGKFLHRENWPEMLIPREELADAIARLEA